MRKVICHNFFPTKAEEEALKSSNTDFRVRPILVEVADDVPPPLQPNPANPWSIKKRLTIRDIVTGRLILSHHETLEYIFRPWSVEMGTKVVQGEKVHVEMLDFTDVNGPKRYFGEGMFLSRVPNANFYVLSWTELARDRVFIEGDEIGLSWYSSMQCFFVKFFRE